MLPAFRRTFTRDKFVSFLRTLVYVVPLTILIWVYAEREQIATVTDVTMQVDVRSATGGKLATLVTPSDHALTVEMEGPRVKLESLRQALMTDNNGMLVLDIDTGPGTATLPTARLLSDQPKFKSAGVKVTAAVPSELLIKVDELVSRDLTVVAGPGVDFDGPPVFTPPTVHVTGPRTALDRMTITDSTGQQSVAISIPRNTALSQPGPHQNVELPVPRLDASVEGSTAVTINPPAVHSTYRVRNAGEDSVVVERVPVLPVAPMTFFDNYRVEYAPELTNVTVRGAPSLISALKDGGLTRVPKALLEVGPDDLPPDTPRKRRVRFDLPEGLTVSPQDQAREVEFTITRRSSR